MKKFEYKIEVGSEDIIKKEDEFLLNELGEKGWELVAKELVKNVKTDGILGGKRQVYWLKRELKS